MKKTLIFLAIFLFSIATIQAQEIYHRARIWLSTERDLQSLAELGLDVDHGTYKKGTFVENDFSISELELVKAEGLKVEVLIENVSAFYAEQGRNLFSGIEKNINCSSLPGAEYSPIVPSNFQLGSYAGYYTTQEMFDILASMRTQYPNLISEPAAVSDTLTHEGRSIYYWRISDNPSVQQSKPRVLYTSLIHAREPGSLSQTLFFMWYLLENYGTDPEVTYLIDNTELYFVPMINPDGYAHNESTNPNGGGMHRKNRNLAHGTTNRGVDLNRNFSYEWGTTGVSFNGNSDTYPGTGPFSEPETQNMKKIAETWGISFAFNAHTYSKLLLYPIGATVAELADDHDYFHAYSQEMVIHNGYDAIKSSGLYPASGDSDDYMYKDHGIFAITPEVGAAFWSPQSEILGDCIDMLYPNIVMAHLPHVYGVAKDLNESIYMTSLTGEIDYSIMRLGQTAGDLEVSITPLQGMLAVSPAIVHTDLEILDIEYGMIEYTLDNTLEYGDLITYVINVDNGLWVKRDTITKIFGMATLQFSDNAQNADNWTGDFALTTEDFVSAPHSFTDSPFGNYAANANENYVFNQTVDLTQATSAAVRFHAKWHIENDWDYVQFQVSTDNGMTWEAQCGKYTNPGVTNSGNSQPVGEPLYDGLQSDWVLEEINLSDYLGEQIRLRFILRSDGFVQYDGFYFDNFELMYNLPDDVSVSEESKQAFALFPNPASDIVKLAFPNIVSGEVQIIDLAGKRIFSTRMSESGNYLEINIQQLMAGVYQVLFTDNSGTVSTQRLVIVR
jgi:carboxypeptidase T